MAVKLIGKVDIYTGNKLFEILCNLKNYGVGRVVMRNSYKKYPELSFYIIRKVVPLREPIGVGPEEMIYGNVWVEEVFRGRKLQGLKLIQDPTYLPDWRLIPREEEGPFLNYQSQEIVKTLPKHDTLPPVLADIMKKRNPDIQGEPQMEVVYNDLSEHLLYKIAEDGMTPDYKLKVKIPEKFKIGIKP